MLKHALALLPVVALGAIGCAHKPPTPVDETGPAPVAKKETPPAPVEKAAPTPTAEEDLAAILSGAVLHFDFDQAELKPESRERLDRVAEALKTHKGVHVKISGHCDERGTEEYNIALGQRRAEVARKYLVALGVDPSRVDTVSFGAERPAVTGHDESAWAQNRRDEIAPQQ